MRGMTDLVHFGRACHIALGMAGFTLGLAAVLLPKFGPKRRWHRLVGRGYAVAMLGAATLSVPLAARVGSTILFVTGVLTFLAVAAGWLAIRQLRGLGEPASRFGVVRRHAILMSSSYIAAWTAFLLNNPIPLGGRYQSALNLYGPTIVGTALIVVALRRLRGGMLRPPAALPAAG